MKNFKFFSQHIIYFLLLVSVSCSSGLGIENNETGEPMKECLEINAQSFIGQVEFQGIYPGKTNLEEALRILGEPKDSYTEPDGSKWFLFEGVSIVSNQNKIIKITSYLEGDNGLTARDYIETYGCPNEILKTKKTDEHPGSVILIYNNAGLRIDFLENARILLTDKPRNLVLFPPTDIKTVIAEDPLLSIADSISWSEAFKTK